VARDGQVELAAAGTADAATGRPLTPDTTVRVASVTKPLTATAVLTGCREYGAELDDPVLGLLPELRDGWRAAPGISVRRLLSHTAGLHPDLDKAWLADLGDGEDALGAAVAEVVGRGQLFRYGAAWQYCNGGFWLAGHVLARLAGTTFETAVHRLLLGPLGMSRTGFTPAGPLAVGHEAGAAAPPPPYPRARRPSGGYWSTVADLLTFAESRWDDPLFAVATRPVAPALWGSRYGLGWALAGGIAWHDGDWGNFRSRLVVVPAHRYATVMVVNDRDGGALLDALVWPEVAAATGVRLPGRWSRRALAGTAFVRRVLARFGR
jgi:CubicO group peptidase (beta-lactamase class C family)